MRRLTSARRNADTLHALGRYPPQYSPPFRRRIRRMRPCRFQRSNRGICTWGIALGLTPRMGPTMILVAKPLPEGAAQPSYRPCHIAATGAPISGTKGNRAFHSSASGQGHCAAEPHQIESPAVELLSWARMWTKRGAFSCACSIQARWKPSRPYPGHWTGLELAHWMAF